MSQIKIFPLFAILYEDFGKSGSEFARDIVAL